MKAKVFLSVIFVSVLMFAFTPRPVQILMAGDSTMADKPLTKNITDSVNGVISEELFLERGWGQLLREFISEKGVVKNFAKNGRSTRTFIEEGLWTELLNNAQKGDYVIIQFAHNDASVAKGERYTNPVQFRLNFTAFVSEVKLKGAKPILCTSVARRKFDENGTLVPTHGEYPEIIRTVAKQQDVTLVDMERITSDWLQREGVTASNRYFHKIPAGVSKLYPDGLDDNTHFNDLGAKIVANLFVNEVKRQKIKGFIHLLKK